MLGHLFCCFLHSFALSVLSNETREYGVVVCVGRVLGSTGTPWSLPDIAIKDDLIVRVGQLQRRGAAIDQEGDTTALVSGINAYLRGLEEKGIAVNFGTYYSATQARVAVIGDSAINLPSAQYEKMKTRVATVMDAGEQFFEIGQRTSATPRQIL